MTEHQTAKWCCQIAGHRLKEKDSLFPFVKRMSFFFYACAIPFSCKGPLGVSANFPFFFLKIQFRFFYLFIYSFPTRLIFSFNFFVQFIILWQWWTAQTWNYIHVTTAKNAWLNTPAAQTHGFRECVLHVGKMKTIHKIKRLTHFLFVCRFYFIFLGRKYSWYCDIIIMSCL